MDLANGHFPMLTVPVIKRAAGEYDCEVVTRLRIPSASISRLCNLETCTSLVELSLPQNSITMIEGLDSLAKLVRLDLSGNRISRIENLAALRALQRFDVRGNEIAQLGDVRGLAEVPQLVQLFLQTAHDSSMQNPVCNDPDYYTHIKGLVPALESLDGERVALKESVGTLLKEADDVPGDVPALPTSPWCGADFWTVPEPASQSNGSEMERETREIARECLDIHKEANALLMEISRASAK